MTWTDTRQNPADRIDQYLDTVGDGTGTKNAIGDYSSAVEEFKIIAPARGYQLERMLIIIRDAGQLTAEKYGTLATLTNGIECKVRNSVGSVVSDLTDGIPVKSNVHWGRLCYDVGFFTFPAGDAFVLVRWTFAKAGKSLYIPSGYYLSVDLNDDLTGLVEHYFLVQGHLAI